MRELVAMILAWDTSSPGWFTRAVYDDGHQLDEPCDGSDLAEAPIHEMEARVAALGGRWSPPSYHDGGDGHFEWRAERRAE